MDNSQAKVEEFKQLVTTGKEYYSFFLKSFVVYLAVLGVLLKLYFDATAGSVERLSLFIAGCIFNVGAVAITLVGRRYCLEIAAHFREVTIRLGVTDVYFPGLVATGKAFLTFICIVGLFWFVLIAHI